MRHLFLLIALLAACDNFDEVRKQNTIEAYESYIDQNPESRHLLEARTKLEGLMIERARSDKSLASYDAYLERFPKGAFARDAFTEREAYLWDWAEIENTIAAWDKYLEEYPSLDAKKVRQARKRKAAAEYRDKLSWGEPQFEQANLAEDPEGPLNGWKFTAEITNNGDKVITALHMTVRYLDDNGNRILDESWPAVAPNFGVPVEEWRKEPLKPGESRQWDLLSDKVPAGWSKKLEFFPTSITFEKMQAAPSK